MKMTTMGTLGLVLAVFAAAASAQTVNPAKLKIRGIVGLDSTYSQVLKALGKPIKDGKPTAEECAGGREKSVEYGGLSLSFMDATSKNKKTFQVTSFEVTSGDWAVSGVKVGDTATTVRAKFGRNYKVETDQETGATSWNYDMGEAVGPGGTRVVFKGGKVVSISSSYTVC